MAKHDRIVPRPRLHRSLVPYVCGIGQGFYVPEGVRDPKLWLPRTPEVHNDILYGWAGPVSKLLRGVKGENWAISGMYFEFDNSGVPVDPVPIVDREEGLDYYNNLVSPRDYLRVSISATGESSSDPALYPENNISEFWAQSAGTVGIHGLAFSDAANSRVYGGALVVMPDVDDSTSDIVFSRFYFPSANQLDKLVGSQIGLRRTVEMG